jgi:hypothetical protein
MQNAETVLGIIRERGRRGLPLEHIYRQLTNRSLYLLAYGRIARNDGATTPGATEETADGMSLAKIDAIIEAVRHERYRWTPARRVYIEKKNSTKKRPLGLPTWSDKLLQEVMRLILEAVLRAAVLRPLPRLPRWTGVPHRARTHLSHMDRYGLVHRRRHLPMFRQSRPRGPAEHSAGEHP